MRSLHTRAEAEDPLLAVLDAYIIEDIRRQEESRRRRDEEGRPRVHIEEELPERSSEDTDREESESESIRIETRG